jgi:hypothetical protein
MVTQTASAVAHDVQHAAEQARLAPSIHNTQPWRFVVGDSSLEVHTDPSRQLRVLDPLSRQLVISVGCALFNARVALAERGRAVRIERFADPLRPSLAARLSIVAGPSQDDGLADLARAIPERRTNRRRFEAQSPPEALLVHLAELAARESAWLSPVLRPEHRLALAQLCRRADEIENGDPAYRAELRRWTTDDPTRLDGVPAMAVPHVDADTGDDLPMRDFDTHGRGWLPTRTESTLSQCLVLLGTAENRQVDWLRAGEALERVLLELTLLGFAVSPLTQVVEVHETNAQLRLALGLAGMPHMLLRIGRAPQTPPVNRRPLDELTDAN